MKKKLLTTILAIALFCSNITPVLAQENIMLPENSVNLISEDENNEGNESYDCIYQKSEKIEAYDIEESLQEINIMEEYAIEENIVEEISISINEIIEGEDVEEITEFEKDIEYEQQEGNNCFEKYVEDQKAEPIISEESDNFLNNIAILENENWMKENVYFEASAISEGVSENDILKKEESISDNGMEEYVGEEGFYLTIDGKLRGKYLTWSEVVDEITTNAETTKEYVVEIPKDIEIKENLKIPAKIGKLIIRGVKQTTPVRLYYVGDLKLLSNLCFESVDLKTLKYNSKTENYEEYFSTVILNGKELTFKNSSMELASVKGNNKSTLNLLNSHMNLKKAISGVGYVLLEDSDLKAQTINVTSVLTMKSAVLESLGKISLKNIVSDDDKNKIIYEDNTNEKLLNITGNITSKSNEEDEKVILKRSIDGADTEEQVLVRKNAIALQVNILEANGYEKSTFLANVPKAGAAWFVIGSVWRQNNDKTERVIKEVTYKENTKLYCGSAKDNVVLFSSDEESEESFVMEGSFATFQEALNEIDKISNSSKFYRILLNNSEQDIASFSNKSIKFPSKTQGLLIRKSSKIQEGNLYFKGNFTLKCNVKFEDIIFRNNGKCNIALGKYVLSLKNCYSNDNAEMTEFHGITGNGVKKTSALCLEDTVLKVNGSINNVGKIQFLSGVEEELATHSVEEVRRIVPAYPELVANGKINIGDVLLEADGKINGITKFTRKNGDITKITSDIIINGEIYSPQLKKLYFDLQEKIGNEYTNVDLSTLELTRWKQEKGIPVVKALSSRYPYVYLFQNSQRQLIKKSGYFTYYDTGRENRENFCGVELSFNVEGKEEKIYCYSLNDAILEINNQKVKRDYTITLKEEIEENTLKLPQNIKFPNKKYISSLLIQGEKQDENVKLGYLGNLTFTSPVVIKNISFVQMVKKNGAYKTVKEVKDDYPGAVTIKTGGFDLEILGKAEFNTPIKIDGGNKGTLILTGSLNTNTNDFEKNIIKGESVIYGMLYNIHTLSLKGYKISLREARNGRNSKKYIISNNKITNLYLEDESTLEITGVSNKNSLSVQNLSVVNSSLTVAGSGNFKNIVLEGEREAAIFVDKNFNITGNLEVNTNNGYLKTRRKGKGKEPYLNISGKVYLEEGRNPLYIGVYHETGGEAFMSEEPVDLRNAKNAAAQLLTAKNVSKEFFRPMEENYPLGEYSATNTNGYILEKKGAKIYVYAGENYQ